MIPRPIVQPWFLLFSLGIGALGGWSVLQMRRDGGRDRRNEAWMMAVVGWAPLLFWILAQFFAER